MSFRCLRVISLLLTCLGVAMMGQVLRAADSPPQGAVLILASGGTAEASYDQTNWQPLSQGQSLGEGAWIRTGSDGFIDFLIPESGASLRLTANSELQFDELKRVRAGEMVVSNTRLRLPRGAVIGSQAKLPEPSTFEIATPRGKALVSATEYVVRADGAVSAISGSVSVVYRERGAGAVRVILAQGESFDPETRTVVETTPEYLENLIAEVETVRNNAESYKLNGAKVIVKPEKFVSPIRGSG